MRHAILSAALATAITSLAAPSITADTATALTDEQMDSVHAGAAYHGPIGSPRWLRWALRVGGHGYAGGQGTAGGQGYAGGQGGN